MRDPLEGVTPEGTIRTGSRRDRVAALLSPFWMPPPSLICGPSRSRRKPPELPMSARAGAEATHV